MENEDEDKVPLATPTSNFPTTRDLMMSNPKTNGMEKAVFDEVLVDTVTPGLDDCIAVQLPTFEPLNIFNHPITITIGSRVVVNYKGALYKATICRHSVKSSKNNTLIHYDDDKHSTVHWTPEDHIEMESNEDERKAPKKRTCTKKDINSNSNEYERGSNADNNDEFIPVDYETELEEKAPKKIKGRLKSAISVSRMPESKKDNENDEEDHDGESIVSVKDIDKVLETSLNTQKMVEMFGLVN